MRVHSTFGVLLTGVMIITGCGSEPESTVETNDTPAAAAEPAPLTDIHMAVMFEDLAMIQRHIDEGSDLNQLEPTRGSTPLITAIALGKTEAAKLLIDGGADLGFQDGDGSTALHTAAFFARTEIVEALLEAGADRTTQNDRGATAYDAVTAPWEAVQPMYEALVPQLRPAGVELDLNRIQEARPKVAEMLKP